jgi:hypothetical protein
MDSITKAYADDKLRTTREFNPITELGDVAKMSPWFAASAAAAKILSTEEIKAVSDIMANELESRLNEAESQTDKSTTFGEVFDALCSIYPKVAATGGEGVDILGDIARTAMRVTGYNDTSAAALKWWSMQTLVQKISVGVDPVTGALLWVDLPSREIKPVRENGEG